MIGARYDDLLLAQARQAALREGGGSSSFYMAPRSEFDPRLIRGGKVDPAVRDVLLTTWHTWCEQHDIRGSRDWATLWIAGSALTRQWRDEGDLDVLIGVYWPGFFRANPDWRGQPSKDAAARLNEMMHSSLWPTMAEWRGPHMSWQHPFEVTYYVNYQSSDIRDLKPYAAYNLTTDEWDVTPVELPDDWDPTKHAPVSWRRTVDLEISRARDLLTKAATLHDRLQNAPAGPRTINTATEFGHTLQEISALWSDIHSARKRAFGPFGKGYYDFQTFRWQSHKHAGTHSGLKAWHKVWRERRA